MIESRRSMSYVPVIQPFLKDDGLIYFLRIEVVLHCIMSRTPAKDG